jgi:hypothetical protein
MINGGSTPQINYHSHLHHLQDLRDLLLRAGVRPERFAILASDGSDPGLDLTTREVQPEPEFWRLYGTRLERHLQTRTNLIDSTLPGVSACA